MRITLETLIFDGVGPFQDREVFDLREDGVTYVYAPNGHGKTSTIDLVRWLIQGPKAIRENAFRSLKQEEEKNVVNHQRFRELGSGSVEAILNVEGRGRYRLERKIPFGTSPSSVLTIEEERDGDWVELDDPEGFLATVLPHERLGFNLLTGEHIQEFVDELQGPVVKTSVERLLRDPELVHVYESLSRVAGQVGKKAEAAARAERRGRKLLEKRAELKERHKNLMREVRERESKEGKLSTEIEELNQELAKLDQAEGLAEEKTEIAQAISALESRKERELEAIENLLTGSWRTLLTSAASGTVTQMLEAHEDAQAERADWQRSRGKLEGLRELLEEDTCYCGRELTKPSQAEILDRIERLEASEPTVPTLPADPHTMRAWTENGGAGELAEHLDLHAARLEEIASDLKARRQRLEDVDAMLEGASETEAKRLRSRLKSRRMKINALRDERNKFNSRAIDAQKELNKVKEKLRDNVAADVDSTLLTRARNYAKAFREAIDRALPALQEELSDRTQAIFSQLFQKESEYEVQLGDGSMVPYVVREIDGEEEHVLLSEGEQTRLGLALLFALREVAAERPFLLLDAPFSTLDDEGIYQLLELIGAHDGQVVVFTKNAFPTGRWYDAVEAADPSVYRMDWVKDGPKDREGHTEVSKAETSVLRIQEA